jgi:hypothetical protein
MSGMQTGQVVRALGRDSKMLGPLQPAWNKAWSGWSKWSKHFYKLVNQNNCLFFKHLTMTMHTPWRIRENTPYHLDHPDHPSYMLTLLLSFLTACLDHTRTTLAHFCKQVTATTSISLYPH